MKDRKQRKINQKKSKKIEQVVQAESQIKTPSIVKNDNLWWEQPSYKKNLTDSVDGPLRISGEGYVLRNNGDFPTSSPNELGLIDSSHLLIKSKTCIPDNNLYVTSTLSMQNSPWLGEMGLKVVDNNIMLGAKSFADVEKEKRDAELQEIEEKIEAKYEKKEIERKEEYDNSLKNLKETFQAEREKDRAQLNLALKTIKQLKDVGPNDGEKTHKVKSSRELKLLWDGNSVYDSEDIKCSMTCRRGFPKKILGKCFEDFVHPKRKLSRDELKMSPKEIKGALKNIATNWSEKFSVSREMVESLISFKENEGLIVISDKINFKHSSRP